MEAAPAPSSSGSGAGDGNIALSANRRLTFRCYGAPDGAPVIMLHGTPGSRLLFSATHEIACGLGLRVIAPDRWGYGGTSPHPSPTLAAFAADIEQLADALALQRFAVMGVSGGGPYATAVAAHAPERVSALALVSPVGPIAVTPSPHASAFHRFCFGPLARNPKAVAAVFRSFRRLLEASPRFGVRVGNAFAPPADRRIIAIDAVTHRLGNAFMEGLKQGGIGPATDLGLFCAPWGISLGNARAPARLWLGTADRNVPLAAARALAATLPDCHLEMLPGQGHLWIAVNYDVVLKWIAATTAQK